MRSAAHCSSAADRVRYRVPSEFLVPSLSPRTGEHCAWALHCIQSHAASTCQGTLLRRATSWYIGLDRASGCFAIVMKSVKTTEGICAAYRLFRARTLTRPAVRPEDLAGTCVARGPLTLPKATGKTEAPTSNPGM